MPEESKLAEKLENQSKFTEEELKVVNKLIKVFIEAFANKSDKPCLIL